MFDIKIEKGVKLVPTIKANQYRELANTLEIGDSFVVKTRQERQKFLLGLQRCGLKLMARKLLDGTHRIWCIGKS